MATNKMLMQRTIERDNGKRNEQVVDNFAAPQLRLVLRDIVCLL